MLEYATALNVGKATEHQEDGFFLDPDRELFGVFDSMGGHRTGYIALEAAANLFKRWLATHDSAPFGPLFDLFDFTEALLTEEMREIEPNARGQGTCCTMLSFKGRWCFTTHIGDTRAYLYRNETLTQLTEDHTLSKHYQRFGFFSSEAEFENFPYHNVLVRALLGVSEQAQATGRALRVREGDRFIVCSDGLHKMLETSTIEAILDEHASPSRAAEELMEATLQTEATDNIAIIVINVAEARQDEDPRIEQREWGELRSMVQNPSEISWEAIVRFFNQPLKTSTARDQLHYTRQHIKRWPDRIRRPTPLRWLLEDLDEVHERPELALCDTLAVPSGYLLDVDQLRALYTHPTLQPLRHVQMGRDNLNRECFELIARAEKSKDLESFMFHPDDFFIRSGTPPNRVPPPWEPLFESPYISDKIKEALRLMLDDLIDRSRK